MLIKQLQYLVALGRERHFGRAAAACNVSQPTLSAGIRHLEDEMGVPIVERAQRFRGFTPDGQTILDWAQRIVADYEALHQELSLARQGLAGQLRIGVIPSALPVTSLITGPFARQHPGVNILLRSLTSKEIQRGLDTFELEAGVTYLDNEPLENVRVRPLYNESYFLIQSRRFAKTDAQTVTWEEAAALPLCLLSRDMQNRRIIDSVFRSIGKEPRAQIEANSPISLIAHTRSSAIATILPLSFLSLINGLPDLSMRRLVEPQPAPQIGLVYSARDPVLAVVKTLIASIRRLDMQKSVDLAAGLG
ncbi:LysR substrate-binding domain-containing protein [Dongia soli]|uniref:LysR substrate-binding domain-containing protein n=1 Tax=Dongia soli TaxID=600628 RepID=A0ABU5E6X4_9PROT|nr:LysR substrate-binding domain-containing protein [Dongia soli]MDY0882031.1 LysR substrate-binding domain-containing protein [Dongia soli]